MTNFPDRGFYRGNLLSMLDDMKKLGAIAAPAISAEAKTSIGFHAHIPDPAPDVSHRMGKSEARLSGFTGDQCSNCNSMRMKISGHCQVCSDCGTTTGCS